MTVQEKQASEEIRQVLRHVVLDAGGQRAFGRQHGFGQSYISDMLRGRCRISQDVLDAIGYERIVTYRKKVQRDAKG